MKNKYGIGFLLFLILVVFGITCAYQLSLNKGKRGNPGRNKCEGTERNERHFCGSRRTGS